MAVVLLSGITLFREKSTVHRFGFSGEHGENETVLSVRSNRISLTLKAGSISEDVVIRGQNIASTLRLTGVVIEQFSRNPALFSDMITHPTDWGEHWKSRLSSYEAQYMPESWVSLYHEGVTLFTTNPSTQIDEIERLAHGRELNDSVIRNAASNLIGGDDDIVTQHDSQTAVVFTPFKDYHRAAILERRGGRTGSFAVSAHHPPKPKKPVSYSGFINVCAELIEALTLRAFLDRVKQMVEENRLSGTPITPAQVAGAMGRKRDLMQFINSYERANRTTYRP